MEPRVLAAIITAGASLCVSITAAFLGYRTQRRLQEDRNENEKAIEGLKASLADLAAEKNARREYQYEARRNLYKVCEPIFFQLVERSEDLLHRVYSLARHAKIGELESGAGSLSHDGYYLRSTIHRLIAPVAQIHLLQDQLTFVDLTLDKHTYTQYELAKYLIWSWTDHYEFARADPYISYEPHDANSLQLRLSEPRKYWMQGIPAGVLETAAQALIDRNSSPPRVMRFGKFDYWYSNQQSSLHRAFCEIYEIFHDFSPETRPVLWRVLITQAHICQALIRARGGVPSGDSETKVLSIAPWCVFTQQERKGFDWRRQSDDSTNAEALQDPFQVSEVYLRSRLRDIFVESVG